MELGDAEQIDGLCAALRAALRSPSGGETLQRSRALARALVDPAEPDIAGAHRLLLAPDAELNVIPFSALVDGHGQFLVQRFEVDYLGSGRELLGMTDRPPSLENALIVASPQFDAFSGTSDARPAGSLSFSPLPGTEEEALALHGLMPDARIAMGRDATEGLLKHVKAPRVLHVATHGFFFDPHGPWSQTEHR